MAMRKNEWFKSVFLPSLFEKCGQGQMHITLNQVTVCRRYMREAKPGFYTFVWENRKVELLLNPHGTGQLTFCQNSVEAAEWKRGQEEKRWADERKHADVVFRKNPEEFDQTVEKLKEDVETWQKNVEEDIILGDAPEEIAEDKRILSRFEKKLEIWLSIAKLRA